MRLEVTVPAVGKIVPPEPPGIGGGVRIRRWTWGADFELLRRWLAAAGIVAIPTESSYGLAVDAGNLRAVEGVYDLKSRERGKPLPVVVADTGSAAVWVEAEHPLVRLAGEHWPAPLTVVVPLRQRLAAAAGGATLAIRVPAHPGLRHLLGEIRCPLTATSANRAGEPSILDPKELGPRLAYSQAEPPGTEILVIDDGILPGGPPSTLVDWYEGGPRLLRSGAFPFERLLGPRP